MDPAAKIEEAKEENELSKGYVRKINIDDDEDAFFDELDEDMIDEDVTIGNIVDLKKQTKSQIQ